MANHWNTPVSDTSKTIIIIPIKRNNISNLSEIAVKASSSFIIPIRAIISPPIIVAQGPGTFSVIIK